MLKVAELRKVNRDAHEAADRVITKTEAALIRLGKDTTCSPGALAAKAQREMDLMGDRALSQDDVLPGTWEKAISKPRRKLNSVVMDETLQAEILRDMKKFSSDPQYYADLGIPYRRGYLLQKLIVYGVSGLLGVCAPRTSL